MLLEVFIENKGKIYKPVIDGDIVYRCEKNKNSSDISFNVIIDGVIDFIEGNRVTFKVDGRGVFIGYIFSKSRDKNGIIEVKAYDQVRYLKNKDTRKTEVGNIGSLIRSIASEFNLQVGDIIESTYNLESKIHDNKELITIIIEGIEETEKNDKQKYIFYDKYGKLSLVKASELDTDFVVNRESAENFKYTSSIDGETYNKIKIAKVEENETKEFFEIEDDKNIKNWGVLQLVESINDDENIQQKGKALLERYNKKTRTLSVNKVFGSLDVIAGSLVTVDLPLGDIVLGEKLMVSRCTHRFNGDSHFMDLTLVGGEFGE